MGTIDVCLAAPAGRLKFPKRATTGGCRVAANPAIVRKLSRTRSLNRPASDSNFTIRGIMNCEEIIAEWLKEKGFDGLYFPGECACLLNDLVPCGEYTGECEPGYKRDVDPSKSADGEDWRVERDKPEPEGGGDEG